MEKKINLDVSNLIDYDYIMGLKIGSKGDGERSLMSMDFKKYIENLRNEVNLLHQKKELKLATYLDPFIQQMIDFRVQRLHNDHIDDKYIVKFQEELKKLIYESNEYGIKY
jgi:hypothetical protein